MAGTAPFGPARVLWLLEWLPEGSAIHAWLRGGPEHVAWPLSTSIAAGALNALRGANYQRGGGRGQRPPTVDPPVIRNRVAGNDRPGHERTRAAKLARRRAIAAARTEQKPDHD